MLSYLTKKYVFSGATLGNHLVDVRALCNGFLAGAVGVSVGSAGMQPYWAVLAGVISAPCYLIGCQMFEYMQVDDPLQNSQVYLLPIIWSAFNSAVFQDSEGIIVPKKDGVAVDLLGI